MLSKFKTDKSNLYILFLDIMESIQRFCGLPQNSSFKIWDNKTKTFTNCFQWTAASLSSHCILMVCLAYLFGVSGHSNRKTNRKETWIAEVLCVLISLVNIGEVVSSYSLKQHHPPAYVLSRTLSTAAWMLCFAVHLRTRSVLRLRKKNNSYILFCSTIVFISTTFSFYSVVKQISDLNDLHFEKWPVMYYGVILNFFFQLCFVITCIGMAFVKLKQTSFNRSLPSLIGNVSIQAGGHDKSRLVESGVSSQGSYCETYVQHKEKKTDIYLGQAETNKNPFSKLVFWWSNRLILKGYHNQLNTPEDLYMLPSSLDTRSIKERFSSMLRIQKNQSIFAEFDNESITDFHKRRKKKPFKLSVLKTFNTAYGKEYYSLGVLKFLNDCLNFAGPLLLNRLVNFMENKKVQTVKLFVYLFLGSEDRILLSPDEILIFYNIYIILGTHCQWLLLCTWIILINIHISSSWSTFDVQGMVLNCKLVE